VLSVALTCAMITTSFGATSQLSALARPSSQLPLNQDLAQRYIIVLKPGADRTDISGAVSVMGESIEKHYRSVFNGYVATLTPSQLAELHSNPAIQYIEPDQAITVMSDQVNPPNWGLDRIDQENLPLDNHYVDLSSGAGVTAYIIDTGIAPNAQFGDRLATGYSAFGDSNTVDCQGHGTHVAGTIGSTLYGVAKSVTLVPVRVFNGCDPNAGGFVVDLINGINWTIINHLAGVPAVINMSLGAGPSSALDAAVESAIADGIVVVVAAGNDGDKPLLRNSCNSSPGRVPGAITVGATTQTDSRASFSNVGSCIDMFAPGYAIVSVSFDGSEVQKTKSGTSMASPHVAGAVAAIWGRNLTSSATTITATVSNSVSLGKISDEGTGSPNKLLYINPEWEKPLTPTGVTASVLLGGAVEVSWSYSAAPAYPASSFTVTATPSGKTCVWTQGPLKCKVVGLTRGLNYTFNVVAQNTSGNGSTSTTSNAVTLLVIMQSVTPSRILDTRNGTGGVAIAKVGNGTNDQGTVLEFNVLGKGSLPTSAAAIGAVSLNVTAAGTTVGSEGGWVAVYPCGTNPEVSNLNFVSGQITPNAVITPISSAGTVCFKVYGKTDLIADINGYTSIFTN